MYIEVYSILTCVFTLIMQQKRVIANLLKTSFYYGVHLYQKTTPFVAIIVLEYLYQLNPLD